MDPVKEKLNLLKKLASEKKSTNNQGAEMPDMSDKKNSVPCELRDMELNNKQVGVLVKTPEQIDLDSFSFHNSRKEEEDLPIEENSGSLIVFDDIDKIESSESNMDIKMLSTNNETNSNYRLSANTLSNVKSQQPSNRSFTVAAQQEPTYKYISRIRDMYDKERASSTECISSLKIRSPLQRQGSSIKKINDVCSREKLLSPQNSLQSDCLERSAPLASPEILRDLSVNDTDQEEPSVMSSNNGSVRHQTPSQRSQSYITHLRKTFNANSVRSDSIEIAKRNSFVPESSHQIEKIKEKFFKINQPSQRNSYMHPADMNKFASHYKSLRSLKTEDELPSESTKVEQLVKNLNQEAKKNEPRTKKQLHKYQKSVTSDLSSFILERDREIENRKKAAAQALQFEDMDKKLIDKYSRDARYAAESAIIKSSLSKGHSDQPISSRIKNEEIKRSEEPPAILAKSSSPLVSAIAPIMKRTKSILKSPSTFSEKTIHFDDKIDIIPIDRTTDDNSPVHFEHNSQSYENLDQFSSYSSFRPVVAKSNEIEFLKKNYENYDNYRWDYFKDLSPLRNQALARERIFIKSPTPMREIINERSSPSPPSNHFSSSSFARYLAVNPVEDRNRFNKRTNSASFRSQSADLSKLVQSSPKNNFSPDSNLLPTDRPVPQLIPSNARPNLTRQNALSKTFTKSLNEGMSNVGQKQEFKDHVSRSHRQKNRRKNYRKSKHSSSLSSLSSEIDSSELSETESTISSFSSSSYEQKFEARNRLPRANDRKKKNQKLNFQSINNRRTGAKKLNRLPFYSSDDSVCGIPKSSAKLASKLCTSNKQFHKSMDDLSYEATTAAESATIKKKSSKNHLSDKTNEKLVQKNKTSEIKDNSLSMFKHTEPVKQLGSSSHSLSAKNEEIQPKKQTDTVKTDTTTANIGPVRKPLPSYSEVIQAKYNDMNNKNRNSIIFNYQQYSNQLVNNQPNGQSINIAKNQHVTQQQPILQAQHQNTQIRQLNQPVLNSNQAINQAIFQQSRSKSLDPSLSIEFLENKIIENQNLNDDRLTMPYQSAAIQERLRQFEKNANTGEKKMPTLHQETRQESIRKRSPFASQNKENSPLANFNQLGFQNQRHTVYQPVNLATKRKDPELMFPVRSNLSTTKSVSNINLVKVPSMPNSKPLFNVNLTSATAAASAAVKQQNDFTRNFQSCVEKPQASSENVHEHRENLKSMVNVKQALDLNNNLIRKDSNYEQKNHERAKSGSPLVSDSSKPPSRRNSPHKSLAKVPISLAPPTSEDVEMISTASSSSNKENNSDNLNETNNEPSKLSISEKLKLFSGSNNFPNSVPLGANLTKKPNSVHNSTKINFKSQNNETEGKNQKSNLTSTKSFNYIEKVSVLKENINKNNNSDESSQTNKPTESLASIKKKFEGYPAQEKNIVESSCNRMEDNTDNQSSDSPSSSKEPKLSFYRSKKDLSSNDEKISEAKNSHESSPLNFGMTIQERMAALRKNGEEDWRKRSASTSNEEKQITGSNLVKQQKEQLKQQLNQINIATRSNSNIKRNVLEPFLNEIKANQKHENISDDNEELDIKKNKMSQSNESLDVILSHNQNILEKSPIKIQEKRPSPIKQSKLSRIQSAGSDTDSMLTRNHMAISKSNVNKFKPEKVELFSTDSEMDSFFKDDILNKNLLSSNSSGNKTDDNTMNEEFDEEEFDQIVSDAKRLTQESRARPHRKTKSKGNHLKNLQNRTDIKNEYEQRHVPIVDDELTEEQQRQIKEQNALVNEITRMNRFNKY